MKRTILAVFMAVPLPNGPVAPPATALLTYLQVGSRRIGFTADTLVEHDRRVPLRWATFADVEGMFTAAKLGSRGDAASSLRWICYRVGGDAPMSLLLESDEMAGGEYIDGFELVTAGSRPELEADCPTVDVSASAIATDRGIKLGLTRREVENRLSVAGRDSAGLVVFERSLDKVARHPDGRREAYTESASLIIRFRRGRAVEIIGWRMDSM